MSDSGQGPPCSPSRGYLQRPPWAVEWTPAEVQTPAYLGQRLNHRVQ